VTVMTALWGAWPSGHDASCVAGEPAAPSPPSGGRGLPQPAAVIGPARRPAADVQPGVSPAEDDRDVLAPRRGSRGTDHLGTVAGSGGRNGYSPRLRERRRARGVKTVWPGSPHVQPLRSGEPSPVPGLSREGMAAGPGHKRPCNGWPLTGGCPDVRWVFRRRPARYPGPRGIWVHHLAASGPPHARAAVRPPECLPARSEAVDLGRTL
jgi:hypothetical protein